MALQRPLIIGNWKMYKTIDQALTFVDTIKPLAASVAATIGLAVPFTAIAPVAERAKGTSLLVGAQNMNDATEGAFTGEVAALQLVDAGARFVIVGHSERRKYFGETNALINKKVQRALQSNLLPLLCVGESLEEREAGHTEAVLTQQLTECLAGVNHGGALMVAYEPLWAIGTGRAATPEVVNQAHAALRKALVAVCGEATAKETAVLYGGSVKAANAGGFLAGHEVDGLLVGSASLDPEEFIKIIEEIKV